MQDIDFDEIDRAVNSMANTAADAPAMVVTDSQTNTQPVAPQQTVEPAATQEVVASPVVPSPAARRSSGRFMDVVHSSSDMRPSALERSSAPSVPNLHREAVPEREEVASRPEPAAALSAAFHWPDPIDLAQPTPSPVEIPSVVIEPSVPEVTPEVIEEPTPTPLPEDLIDDDEDVSPLESPFLFLVPMQTYHYLKTQFHFQQTLPLIQQQLVWLKSLHTKSTKKYHMNSMKRCLSLMGMGRTSQRHCLKQLILLILSSQKLFLPDQLPFHSSTKSNQVPTAPYLVRSLILRHTIKL
jgi:hypothetical protein